MPRPKVLVADALAEEGLAILREQLEVDARFDITPEQLAGVIAEYEAVIVRSRTRLPGPLIESAGRLRVIGRAGSGLDNIDVSVARDLGIEVLNCPGANSVAVAEHTIGLLLALARHLCEADRSMKAGRWEKKRLKGIGIEGRTLGIIGFGRIGREVAHRAQSLGMNVVVNQPRLTPELALEAGVHLVDLLDLLRESDFVTLHIPMRPENAGFIGAQELALMKPSAFLINAARGGLVDEQALLEALESGRLAGAAVDVFEQEPPTDSALARHPQVIATPHIAASTDDAQVSAAVLIAQQVVAHFEEQEGVAATLALRMVPLSDVVPHEAVDMKRVRRLAEALQRDGVLANPPVTAEYDGRYVVLDGATRLTACREMALPHIVVQVVDPWRPDIALHTWSHVISGGEAAGLHAVLGTIDGLQLTEIAATEVQRELIEREALAYFGLADGRFWLAERQVEGPPALDVLNALVAAYTEWGEVARTLTSGLERLRIAYPQMVALVVFPSFRPEDALRAASQDKTLPQGITRFVIPGRVLRLNVPLERLGAAEPLAAKRRWLDQFVQAKLDRQRVRYYHEPVVLLED